MSGSSPSTSPWTVSDRAAALLGEARRRAWHARRGAAAGLRRVRSRAGVGGGGSRLSLDELGLRHGTDKSHAHHDYLRVYEAVFGHLRDESFEMLEIGVHQGASLRMWQEYFPAARFVGFDRHQRCKEHETPRARVVVGDQSDRRAIEQLALDLDPLLVIDDGSHIWDHQVNTFRTLWPALRPGGYYVVEDIQTSFGDRYRSTHGKNQTETAYDYVAALLRGVVAGPGLADAPRDQFETHCRETIAYGVSLPHAVILRKKDNGQRRWYVASVADLAREPVTTDVGPAYHRVPGEVVGASDEVRKALQAVVAQRTVAAPPVSSAEMTDVTVVGNGMVLTADGKVLDESLNCARSTRRSSGMYKVVPDRYWVNEHPVAGAFRPAVPGQNHVLLKQTWDRNYGHWLVDTLPRLSLVPSLHDPASCVFFLNTQKDEQMTRVVLDSMAMAGVSEDQILFLPRDQHRFERITVLGAMSSHPVYKAPAAIRFLEGLAGQVPPAPDHERVFVSRSTYSRRRLLNEEQVLEVLADEGYRTVRPESMSFQEQVAAFRGATHVVGPMGAALSSAVFGPPGLRMLTLATPSMKHDFFYDIVCHKDGRYRGLQGTTADERPWTGSDFSVDVDQLRDSLRWLHRD